MSLQKKLLQSSSLVSPHIHALKLVSTSGETIGRTVNFSWNPYDSDIVMKAQSSQTAVFGNAFRNPSGYELFGIATPVYSPAGDIVGILLVEMHLAPIVSLITAHEGMGNTSEGHIAQKTPNGDAELVTLLRFERDAAFRKVVPKSKNLPINQSLESPNGALLRSSDYRGIDSILAIETLESIGWGLVIKIDSDEALAPVYEIRKIVLIAALLTAIFISLGCIYFLRSLSQRMRRLFSATEMVANRKFNFALNDNSRDEIGQMAHQLDELASELATGTTIGVAIQEQLRFKDSHDELTEVLNRSALFKFLDNITEVSSTNPTSVLAVDLRGMETVNSTYGKGVGDELLIAFARSLLEVAPDKSSVARWNGHLFVMVAPGTDLQTFQGCVSRLKHTLEGGLKASGRTFPGQFNYGLSTACSRDEIANLLKKAMNTLEHWKQLHKSQSKNYLNFSNHSALILLQKTSNLKLSLNSCNPKVLRCFRDSILMLPCQLKNL